MIQFETKEPRQLEMKFRVNILVQDGKEGLDKHGVLFNYG
jgi:hypothetical protein